MRGCVRACLFRSFSHFLLATLGVAAAAATVGLKLLFACSRLVSLLAEWSLRLLMPLKTNDLKLALTLAVLLVVVVVVVALGVLFGIGRWSAEEIAVGVDVVMDEPMDEVDEDGDG